MKYIIRSVIFNAYFVDIETMKNNKFKLYWSQIKDEAKIFNIIEVAEKALNLIHNLIKENLELKIIEVKENE